MPVICKKCKSGDVERIPRTFLIKLILFPLQLKRYRCYHCFNKFYTF